MNLKDFCFPVSERQVAVDDFSGKLVEWGNENTYLTADYKSIVRDDTNHVISIVKDSYRIVRNEALINELLQFLAASGENFRIDPSHSFVLSNRMRLQITFPELILQDSESDIALSMFLHNSYDMSEGVRFYFGAIRAICANGMIFGEILGRYYSPSIPRALAWRTSQRSYRRPSSTSLRFSDALISWRVSRPTSS